MAHRTRITDLHPDVLGLVGARLDDPANRQAFRLAHTSTRAALPAVLPANAVRRAQRALAAGVDPGFRADVDEFMDACVKMRDAHRRAEQVGARTKLGQRYVDEATKRVFPLTVYGDAVRKTRRGTDITYMYTNSVYSTIPLPHGANTDISVTYDVNTNRFRVTDRVRGDAVPADLPAYKAYVIAQAARVSPDPPTFASGHHDSDRMWYHFAWAVTRPHLRREVQARRAARVG